MKKTRTWVQCCALKLAILSCVLNDSAMFIIIQAGMTIFFKRRLHRPIEIVSF